MIILHGEHVLISRKELNNIKLKFKKAEILTFDGTKVDLTMIKQSLESLSLFNQERLVIIEGLLSSKNIVKNTALLKYFNNSPSKTNLVFWEKKEIGKKILNHLSGAQIKYFPLPKIIFIFLESLRPGNTATMLSLFLKTIENEAPELIFYMMIRQFIYLLMLKELKSIPSLSPWQVAKLSKQAKWFEKEDLIRIIKFFLKIDYETKTGSSDLSLEALLEQFLLKL